MNDGRCIAPGCAKPSVMHSNRCAKHKLLYTRYGSDFGPGIKVKQLQRNYDEAARQRIDKLGEGGEKDQAGLAWCEAMLRQVLSNSTGRLAYNVKWQRKASEWMRLLPDDEGLQRRLLARLLATEWAIHGNRPAWRERDAEAINRGRLFVAGHGFVAPTSKFVLREVGQTLMDSRLPEFFRKLIEHDERRQEARRLSADAAMKTLEDA